MAFGGKGGLEPRAGRNTATENDVLGILSLEYLKGETGGFDGDLLILEGGICGEVEAAEDFFES